MKYKYIKLYNDHEVAGIKIEPLDECPEPSYDYNVLANVNVTYAHNGSLIIKGDLLPTVYKGNYTHQQHGVYVIKDHNMFSSDDYTLTELPIRKFGIFKVGTFEAYVFNANGSYRVFKKERIPYTVESSLYTIVKITSVTGN